MGSLMAPLCFLAVTASAPLRLDVLDPSRLSPAELLAAVTLQGLSARTSQPIWLKSDGVQKWIEEDLAKEGFGLKPAEGFWPLVMSRQKLVKGFVLCRLGDPSVNAATTLAGIMDGIALDESLAQKAREAGLRELADARGMTDQMVFSKFSSQAAQGMVVEQVVEKPHHLRDFAVKHKAFTFDASDRRFRRTVVEKLAKGGMAWGWGKDEYHWVEDLSASGATGAPADWCRNLSVLESLPTKIKKPSRRPKAVAPGVRAVAFVLSDGDNVQWMTSGFATAPQFYGSPLRGSFPMTWEVSPLLAQHAPRVLQAIYSRATPKDDFVTGPGLPGYTFASLLPNGAAIARKTAPLLRKSGLTIASFLDVNDADTSRLEPWMALREVAGALYKEYSPYHRPSGKVRWLSGKPLAGYRFVLWENLLGIEDLKAKIAAMPTKGEDRLALINVHAWSFGDMGGPLEAVRRVISGLPSDVSVVTASDIIETLVKEK